MREACEDMLRGREAGEFMLKGREADEEMLILWVEKHVRTKKIPGTVRRVGEVWSRLGTHERKRLYILFFIWRRRPWSLR
jgi:hypothetical protein